jgi:hypothetical protein
MRASIACSVLSLVLAQASNPVKAQYVLDLTRDDSSPSPNPLVGGCAVGFSGEKPLTVPLTVTIVKLDRADYYLGGRMLIDLLVTNAGTEPIQFPWVISQSIDLNKVSSTDAVRRVTLTFVALGSDGRDHVLFGTTLEGSTEVSESMQEIKSGETALLRVPGWISVRADRSSRVASAEGQSTTLRAKMMLDTARCNWSAPILSNSAPVFLRMNRSQQP